MSASCTGAGMMGSGLAGLKGDLCLGGGILVGKDGV